MIPKEAEIYSLIDEAEIQKTNRYEGRESRSGKIQVTAKEAENIDQ